MIQDAPGRVERDCSVMISDEFMRAARHEFTDSGLNR